MFGTVRFNRKGGGVGCLVQLDLTGREVVLDVWYS